MDQEGLVITISADVRDAILGLTDLTDATGELAVEGVGNLTAVNQALTALRAAQAEAGNTSDLGKINNAIKDLSAEASRLRSAGTQGFDELGNKLKDIEPAASSARSGFDFLGLSMTQTRVAFTDVARVASGTGFSLRSLGSQLYLLGPAGTIAAGVLYGLYELFNKQTDSAKKADEAAKHLHDTLLNLQSVSDTNDVSIGSEAGNIARVQALAAAIQDTNNSYDQRNNALKQLRETNKAYFGDLTLEASSLATLSDKVKEYANALIAEAVVKGQVDQIAKVSEEYNKQVDALKKLKDAKDRAQATENIGQRNLPKNISSEGEEAAVLQQQSLRESTIKAADAFKDQQEAVDILSAQLGEYRGALNQAIEEQLKFKPLKSIAPTDDLKSVIPILEQIQKIYEEISKPSKEPLFKQNELAEQLNNPQSTAYQLFQAKIQEAFANGINKGADDPKVKSAYDALAAALQVQLQHQQNPDLRARFAFQEADVDDKEVKQFHDDAGKQLTDYMKRLPPLSIKVPGEVELQIKEDIQGFAPDDREKISQGLSKNVELAKFYVNASPEVRLQIDKNLIQEADLKKLQDTIKSTIKTVAQSGVADIGVLVGDSLSKTSNAFDGAIRDFTQVLGNGLIKVGEAMITASSVMEGLNTALKGLFANPAAGIIEGVAAVALGEVVKNVGAKAFAVGGIVTGPTLGLIGEAGPEVVFPLDRLNSFIKNTKSAGDQTVRVVGTIRGRDLAIASARDSKLQGMTS